MKNINEIPQDSHGYVYILSNQGMPGLLKIGMTRFDPSKRVKELSSATGVPTPFELVYYREFNDCVAAEFEIHSILGAKGLRYNDQREFFSIGTTEAINTLLSLKDDVINGQPYSIDVYEDKNFNSDIEEVAKLKEKEICDFENSDFFRTGTEFCNNHFFSSRNTSIDDDNQLAYFVENGLYFHVGLLSLRKFSYDEIDSQIDFILEYAHKGYVSGFIDVIRIYLDSIDGIANLSSEKKYWIAQMLDQFAINYRNSSKGDVYINQNIPLYCAISYVLGLQYDKNFYRIIDLEDDYMLQETWLLGYYDLEAKTTQLMHKLRSEKDAFLGTSCQLRNEILCSSKYVLFHSLEGENAYHQGCLYAYGINGHEKDLDKAIALWKKAIDNNCKKAYLNLLTYNYQNLDVFLHIANKGALDSCPQCLIESASRILSDYVVEEDINKQCKKKINRYLDLFISQIELAFYVDADSCLDAIKVYIFISTAFQRGINKSKLKDILEKIRAISDEEIEGYYTTTFRLMIWN